MALRLKKHVVPRLDRGTTLPKLELLKLNVNF
ncbi:hypothetical protein [Coxiella burnetii]|nr:hypothetical protein [Coxiella burnetii]